MIDLPICRVWGSISISISESYFGEVLDLWTPVCNVRKMAKHLKADELYSGNTGTGIQLRQVSVLHSAFSSLHGCSRRQYCRLVH